MKKIPLMEGWTYRRLGTDEAFRPIALPYDCMLHEARSDDSPGGCNNGWFEGYDYEFRKQFELAPEELGKTRWIEFEGIYHRGEVYVNGEFVASRPNGYLGLLADITNMLRAGTNELYVIARGSDIPNARWYTGVGIYRPVTLHEGEGTVIRPNSIRIATTGIVPPAIKVDFYLIGRGHVCVSAFDKDGVLASEELDAEGKTSLSMTLKDAGLWSPEEPRLYTLSVRTETDCAEETFGIRTVSVDPKRGLLVNGKRVLLRGACLHHDNGLLGSASFAEAEERKAQLLRRFGFNAIRSSHNPCSKALLAACDKYGMFMMDEYADSWYIRKTKYDYALYLEEWYERDLRDMAEKDCNHPCVILYSLGNEVTESAEKRGVELFKKMRDVLRSYDPTRPITCGINIGFNQAQAGGHGFYSDRRADENDFKNLGTEEANHRKWMFGPLFTKLNAILPGCDRATKEIFSASDVAGYNYGILRYRHDRRKYPDRIILGSETFCEDAERFMRAAERDPGIIGDFVWTGMDHIGEAGLGSWEYRDYAPTFVHTKGWLTSGAGRIDITGKPLPEAYYMAAAYGMLKKPFIAVRPVNHNGERHSPSGWKFTDAVESWAWEGCEGKPAHIEVYGCGNYVELYLNNKKLGHRSLKRHCRVHFKTPYEPGTLTAIVFDETGRETGRTCLRSARTETCIRIEPENGTVRGKLSYIRLRLTDKDGTTKVLTRDTIKVSVEGGELVGLGHGCPFNDEGYTNDETSTYFGEALAIVRAGDGNRLTFTASTKDASERLEITVK